MRPITTSVEVPNSTHDVYEFLEVLGNHESFMDHFMVDWELSGPKQGVGAKANVRVKATAEKDWTDVEIVEAGALDGLTREQIAPLAPEGDDEIFVTRLADGSSVFVGKTKMIPRIEAKIAALVKKAVS